MRSSFLSCFIKFRSAISENKSKMFQPIRGQGGHLCFLICLKNINLVEDSKTLLPVKFSWILFGGWREEVENVLANQRPQQPLWFSDRPKKHKLGRGCWVLAFCQFFFKFHSAVPDVSADQRPGQPSWLTFLIGSTNTDLVEDVEFFSKWFKFCSMVLEDNDEQTDGRQRLITMVNLSLWLRCTKNLSPELCELWEVI